jgi:hypothetical protein
VKTRPHNLQPWIRGLTWRLCVTCGLLTLKNAATEGALRRSCPGRVDD